MKIIKICEQNKDVKSLKDSTCVECGKNKANVALFLGKGMPSSPIPLCLNCAWTLEDLLDNTTEVSFTRAEK